MTGSGGKYIIFYIFYFADNGSAADGPFCPEGRTETNRSKTEPERHLPVC